MQLNKLTKEVLNELVRYDDQTGKLYWKPRPEKYFKTTIAFKVWNKNFSLKEVGSLDKDGYLKTCILGKHYRVHRLIWMINTGDFPQNIIDHKDRNKLNNKFSNLRDFTFSQNSRNINIPNRNTSGVVGVVWHKRQQKWMAQINIGGKMGFLGYFKTKLAAATVRHIAGLQHQITIGTETCS